MGSANSQSPLCYYYYYYLPWYSVPRVGQKIKYKEIKLEWFLILMVLNRKIVVQQDRVKALHDIIIILNILGSIDPEG